MLGGMRINISASILHQKNPLETHIIVAQRMSLLTGNTKNSLEI